MNAIQVRQHGGPEVLRALELDAPEPGPGEVRVRVRFAGVNFIDVYHRTGLYELDRPFVPGVEGAGEVDALGQEVTGVREGDRVAWTGVPGSYAELAIVPAHRLVAVPSEVTLETAAAVLLQGLTAHYLTRSTFILRGGTSTLVHAAAGGVGLLLLQMARSAGARVIGTVSTEEKAALARAAGAEQVVRYTEEDFVPRARGFGGDGVEVVYDSVGRTTFEGSMRSLRRRGTLVLFGQSSGPVPPLDPGELARRGSLYLTRPRLGDYTAQRSELLERAQELFGWLGSGRLDVRVDRLLPLSDADRAHRLLEGRETSGKVLLAC